MSGGGLCATPQKHARMQALGLKSCPGGKAGRFQMHAPSGGEESARPRFHGRVTQAFPPHANVRRRPPKSRIVWNSRVVVRFLMTRSARSIRTTLRQRVTFRQPSPGVGLLNLALSELFS